MTRAKSHLEERFALMLLGMGISRDFVREYRFDPKRRWRCDFFSKRARLCVELEGGIWIQGGHTRGARFQNNVEKYNAIQCAGLRLLRYTSVKDMARFESDYQKLMEGE